MAERNNKVVCSFDPTSPRITAYDVHEWIHAALRIPENKVSMIQIDGIKRQVFIKLTDPESLHALLHETSGRAEYKYPNGEISIVNIGIAGMGIKRIRVANLPPEVQNDVLQRSLTSYGKVMNVHAETWAKTYRYQVSNGVRQVVMQVTRHLPSHLTIAGHRVLLSYEGQPATCYGCGEIGHMYQGCPTRRAAGTEKQDPTATTYASVLAHTSTSSGRPRTDTNTTIQHATVHDTIVEKTTAIEVPDRNTDTGTSEKEPSTIKNIGNAPTPAPETEEGKVSTPLLSDRREEGGPISTDSSQSNGNARRKRDTQTQRVNTGTGSMDHMVIDQPSWSENDESQMDEHETYSLPSTGEETHDRRHKPKTHKKMKTEQNTANHPERSRSLPRRMHSKGGKP